MEGGKEVESRFVMRIWIICWISGHSYILLDVIKMYIVLDVERVGVSEALRMPLKMSIQGYGAT